MPFGRSAMVRNDILLIEGLQTVIIKLYRVLVVFYEANKRRNYMRDHVFQKRNLFVVIISSLIILFVSCASAGSGFIKDTRAIEKAAKSVLKLEVQNKNGKTIATGSGFVVFENNCLLTNYHVVAGGSSVLAISDDEVRYTIDYVLCADQKMDIAILGFKEPTDIKPLSVSPNKNHPRGSEVIAIGSPIGIKNTVSSGIISSVYEEDGVPWIQITAPISHGSSGGAVFNDSGEVIGISSASYTRGQNLNLAINIGEALAMYKAWEGNTYSFDSLPHSARFDYSGVYPTEEEARLASYDDLEWTCPECGEKNNSAFCVKCGAARPLWECVCGEMSITAFCGNCGRSLEEIGHIIDEVTEKTANGMYEEAARLLSGLKQFNSLSVLTSAGDHYSASDKLQEVYNAWYEQLYASKNYDQAIQILDQMVDSEAVQARKQKAYFDWIDELLELKRFDEAVSLLDTLEDLPWKEELTGKVYFALGCKYFENGDYKAAETAFRTADGYPGVNEKLAQCQEKISSNRYDDAMKLFDEGHYSEALSIFEEIASDQDVKDIMDECLYQEGLFQLKQSERYKAARCFFGIKGYKDVNDLIAGDKDLMLDMLDICFSNDSRIVFGKYHGREVKWVSCGLINKQAVLITESVVEKMWFADRALSKKKYTSDDTPREIWKNSSVRKWLNETFYKEVFNKREKELIVPFEIQSIYASKKKPLFSDKVTLSGFSGVLRQPEKAKDSWTGWAVSSSDGQVAWKAEYLAGNHTYELDFMESGGVKPVIQVDISKMDYDDLMNVWPDV